MALAEIPETLARIPPFTLVVLLILAGFTLAGYALYVVDRGRR